MREPDGICDEGKLFGWIKFRFTRHGGSFHVGFLSAASHSGYGHEFRHDAGPLVNIRVQACASAITVKLWAERLLFLVFLESGLRMQPG